MSLAEPVRYRANPINLGESAARLPEAWSPRVAVKVNDVLVKVVTIEGDFVWHNHPDTDEAFLVLGGSMAIDVRDGDPETERRVELAIGDMFVVPREVFHCPRSRSGATIALLEGTGVVNTGNSGGQLTAPVDRWLDPA